MILMLVPPLMLLAAMLVGGRPEKLLALPIRWSWLAPVALGVEWLLVRVPGTMPTALFGALLLGAHAALVLCLLLNRRLPGLKIALAGALLNLVVIAANGGLMPITPDSLAAAGLDRPNLALGTRLPLSKDVLLAPNQVVLGALGDNVATRWPVPIVFSPGDILIAAGLGSLVFLGMQPRRRRPRAVPELWPA